MCGFLGETYGWHYGFAAAGVGMLAGLVIYLYGQGYLPRRTVASPPVVRRRFAVPHGGRDTFLLLLGIGLAVTVFRGAYEQIGNTIALWMRDDVDRVIGGVEIGAAMFFSLNPLLVMVLTPLLLRALAASGGARARAVGHPEDGGRRTAGRGVLSAGRRGRGHQPAAAARTGFGCSATSSSSRSASFTSCRTASASSRGLRRRSSAPARSPPGTWRSSAAASPRARSGACGAASATSRFS